MPNANIKTDKKTFWSNYKNESSKDFDTLSSGATNKNCKSKCENTVIKNLEYKDLICRFTPENPKPWDEDKT
ncbi:MAG: hypothetical protein FWE01_00165 [Firmicutes bacterium]|nr:hypothetical protein [Bacillota bacterium]